MAPQAAGLLAQLDLWRGAVERRTGMAFGGTRARILAQAVARRAESCGHASDDAYRKQLLLRPDADPEWTRLVALLRNGDTRFFRDGPAFAALVGHALPDLCERRRAEGVGKLSLWSAGCSTGQEAYSLAIACLSLAVCNGFKIEVTGTDASPDAVTRATAGVYRDHEAATLPPAIAPKFFDKVGDRRRASAELRRAVEFRECDLLGAPPLPSNNDVVFCQNVLVYYRPDARAELLRRLTAALAPGGYLFLGAAEAVGLPTPGLHLVRLQDTWIYRRAA